jgi:hypothetical protein
LIKDPAKTLTKAYKAVLVIGCLSLIAGLLAVLFELRLLQQLEIGWMSVVFGTIFLILAHYIKRESLVALAIAVTLYSIELLLFFIQLMKGQTPSAAAGGLFRILMLILMVRGFGAIRALRITPSPRPVPLGQSLPQEQIAAQRPAEHQPQPVGPKPISFVAPAPPLSATEPMKTGAISKSITPEVFNLRFVAYRCEISSDRLKIIFQNSSQTELKWFEISALVVRQFPFQPPWEGKVLLDLVPVVGAGEKIYPVRILSSTYVNYGILAQGQSASAKENIRRLASYLLLQNLSIFIDPGTDYFIHAGQPPVRFLSMSQFTEYDSRYG